MEQNKPVESYDPELQRDPQQQLLLEELERVAQRVAEEHSQGHDYIFDHQAFIESLDHVVADQLSALRGDKLLTSEWTKRFNRWYTFCDAVINMGVSCIYQQKALEEQDYETVFKGIRINAAFSTTFLKPRGIEVVFSHKSEEVKANYKWLAMPCLIVTDAKGVKHEIAITPSDAGSKWWWVILSDFHANFNWNMFGGDSVSSSTVDDPFAAVEDMEVTEEEEEAFKAIPRPVIKSIVLTGEELMDTLKAAENGVSDRDYVNTWIDEPKGFFTKVLNFFKRILNIKGT